MTQSDMAQELKFSRLTDVDSLVDGNTKFSVEADEGERKALAKRFGLVDLSLFEIDYTVSQRRKKPVIRVTGTFRAKVGQQCVVTMVSLVNDIEAKFEVYFSREDDRKFGNSGDVDWDPELADPPEPVINGNIDVGVVVAELLALEIDPFPRCENASLSEVYAPEYGIVKDEDGQESANNPFATLKGLKKKLENDA